MQQHNPPHPGGIIQRLYLKPNCLRSNEVAAKLQVNASTFNRLINEKLRVSTAMALKLSKVLGHSPESWLAMQRNFDLYEARSKIDILRCVPVKF